MQTRSVVLSNTEKGAGGQPIAIGHLPTAISDELLYSLLARTISQNAMGPPLQCMEFFFGSRNAIPSIDLPTNLVAVQQRFGEFSPYKNVEQLIDVATLYPYFRPFLPQERHEKSMALLHSGGGKALKVLMGTVANGFGAGPALRYCISCQRTSLDTYGVLFWHRTHNLPGVNCCPVHGIDLKEYGASLFASQPQKLLLPPFPPQTSVNSTLHGNHHLNFSRLAADLLAANLAPICSDLRTATYHEAIRNIGLNRGNGRPAYSELADAIRIYYSDFNDSIHAPRLLSSAKTPLRWIQDCIEKPKRAMHPICHLILIGFLFKKFDAFTAALGTESSAILNRPTLHELINGVAGSSVIHKSSSFFESKISCRSIATELGLSVTTVVNMRRNKGVLVKERRKHIHPALLMEITKGLLLGESIIRVANMHSVSVGSVYRVLQQQPETKSTREESQKNKETAARRDEWMNITKINESKGIKVARAAATAAYAWLYRHDRQWLIEVNSKLISVKPKKRTRIDWIKRDATLVSSAIQFVNAVKEKKSRPRISKALITRYLECGDLVYAYPEKLPRLVAVLPRLAESISEHQKYRVEEAIVTLSSSGVYPVMWKISRKAGIKVMSSELVAHAKKCLDIVELHHKATSMNTSKTG